MSLIEAGAPRGRARLAGLLVHGRGGTPEDMIALAGRLGVDDIRWVAPRAPGGHWYPHRFTVAIEANEPYLSRAVAACDAALDDATEGGRIPPERTVVLGFSQGACLVSEHALRHPGRCAVLVLLTGGLIGSHAREWRPANGATFETLRALVTGSDVDPWVPETRVRETAALFSRFGAAVELQIYRGRDHVVSNDEITKARALICAL